MKVCVLASGSGGNSTYIETSNYKILISFWLYPFSSGIPLFWVLKDTDETKEPDDNNYVCLRRGQKNH